MFGFSNSSEEVTLLIDVGNGSIGAALAVIAPGILPTIVYSTRQSLSVLEKPTAAKLTETLTLLLSDVLTKVMTYGTSNPYWKGQHKNISSALVSFSAPWFVSKTKQLHLSQDKAFVLTQSFLEEVASAEEDLFIKELEGENKNTFTLVEKSIIGARVNGYSVNNILNKKTKTFDTSLFLSVVGTGILEKVKEVVARQIHIASDKIKIHSFPLISFSMVRDVFRDTSDFILMDITGEVTDITVISEDVITQTASFPFGRNFLVRQIAKNLNVSPEIAVSTLQTYLLGKLDELTVSRVRGVLSDAEKEWALYWNDCLTSLFPAVLFPSKIYITADSDTAGIFIDFIKSSKGDVADALKKQMQIIHLNHDVLGKYYKGESIAFDDEFIGVLAVFSNKIKS